MKLVVTAKWQHSNVFLYYCMKPSCLLKAQMDKGNDSECVSTRKLALVGF